MNYKEKCELLVQIKDLLEKNCLLTKNNGDVTNENKKLLNFLKEKQINFNELNLEYHLNILNSEYGFNVLKTILEYDPQLTINSNPFIQNMFYNIINADHVKEVEKILNKTTKVTITQNSKTRIVIKSLEMAKIFERYKDKISYMESINLLFLFEKNDAICYNFLTSISQTERKLLTNQVSKDHQTFLFHTMNNEIINLLINDNYNKFNVLNEKNENFLFYNENLAFVSPDNIKYLFTNHLDINQQTNTATNISMHTLLHAKMFNLLESLGFDFFNKNNDKYNNELYKQYNLCNKFYINSKQGSDFLEFLFENKMSDLEQGNFGKLTYEVFVKWLEKADNKILEKLIKEAPTFSAIMFSHYELENISNIAGKRFIINQKQKLKELFDTYDDTQTEQFYTNLFKKINNKKEGFYLNKFYDALKNGILPAINISKYIKEDLFSDFNIENDILLSQFFYENINMSARFNDSNKNYIKFPEQVEYLSPQKTHPTEINYLDYLFLSKVYIKKQYMMNKTKQILSLIEDKEYTIEKIKKDDYFKNKNLQKLFVKSEDLINQIDWNKRLNNGDLLIKHCLDVRLYKKIAVLTNYTKNEMEQFAMYKKSKSLAEYMLLSEASTTKVQSKEENNKKYIFKKIL